MAKDQFHQFSDVLKKKGAEASAPAVEHAQVDSNEFHSALSGAMQNSAKVKEFVHLYEPHEYSGMKTFLSPDKASGYAVKGDGDIVSVFSTQKGRGDHIMQHALQNGGTKLDAFDGYLPGFYAKHGFEETHREKNWTPGQPDVVYMKHNKAPADPKHAMVKSEYYTNTAGLQEMRKSEMLMSAQAHQFFFMAYDGDNAGRLVGRAILADDPTALHDASNRIAHGHDIVKDWVESHQGKVISGGGDEGTFTIPPQALEDIEKLRADYKYATQLTMTVGVGNSLSEAGKALMVGKFRGKDQVCKYDNSVTADLESAKQHIAGGNGTDEERKLGEAYLTPEGDQMKTPAPMAESEQVAAPADDHSDCQYCQELAQDSVTDEDHCTYCHGSEQPESEPHCQYCVESEAQDHEHTGDDCQYCQESEQVNQADHDHSGDDCVYCQEAAAHDPNAADHAADCQYCAAAPAPTMDNAASHPANYADDNAPSDMGLAENEVPESSPDLSQVLQGGLDNHADTINKEKVVSMVAEALAGFKACKPIIERSQQQAPQLYDASIAMLRAMIEMAKMLGLAPAPEQAEAAIPGEGAEQQQTEPDSNPQPPQSSPQGAPPAGKPLGR